MQLQIFFYISACILVLNSNIMLVSVRWNTVSEKRLVKIYKPFICWQDPLCTVVCVPNCIKHLIPFFNVIQWAVNWNTNNYRVSRLKQNHSTRVHRVCRLKQNHLTRVHRVCRLKQNHSTRVHRVCRLKQNHSTRVHRVCRLKQPFDS